MRTSVLSNHTLWIVVRLMEIRKSRSSRLDQRERRGSTEWIKWHCLQNINKTYSFSSDFAEIYVFAHIKVIYKPTM